MQSESPRYLVWFVVIMLAVCAGSLLATVVRISVVAVGVSLALRKVPAIWAQDYAANKARARDRQMRANLQAQILRIRSIRGRRLLQSCSEWRRNEKLTDTRTTRFKVKERCAAYDRYVNTGKY